ncbi:2-ketoglutarate: NADP oxidoreductase, alpha subunit [marine gamma proteobacterium HTCC2143]|jgi:2-oxoglutarate ferredoxin oxidoreductase subunit alpha|uniref:2-ketoglutarate: NADP oxidoreductase, alpha subunit n=1 Tax=marine gamma proteobacterium HTCC2143 TaxID=247633 RepID=A0YC52_9GAMM|nr:2-ketoglutarate: NADP oxidoreductase, alpha subunit [marine gamma proteobacterium HTCC2143]
MTATNTITSVNDLVIKFANVNGSGSASANNMFAKAVFRMGLSVSPKNIFPSNIQGLPTWYEVRVSDKGYIGRRGGIDIMVCVNPQSMAKDIQEVSPGGFFIYDNTKPMDLRLLRNDITFIGLPLMRICLDEYNDDRQRQLFKNVIYVGALAALINIEFDVLTGLIADQFEGKEKLIAPNIHAMELGFQYAQKHYQCPLSISLQRRDNLGDKILMDGNTACGLGAVYGGATMAGWYPITPSTSVVEGYEKYCKRLRIDPGTGKNNYAIIQAEDELAAIGMVIGASWNGARAFTATSGPGISLMSEFLGLAYFAEIPTVLIDVQRAGPSTGMPTRTQQSDITACAYASHGDTKHVLVFPSTPKECFDMTAEAFDLAEQLQTPIIMLTDLDLGMNDTMSDPLDWDDSRQYKRGKVFTAEDLESMSERFGRYVDVDGDGIPYRTYPGTHPTKGSFFTRGTSRDEYAVYTEDGSEYEKNMQRLLKKWETAKKYVPAPEIIIAEKGSSIGVLHFGTSTDATMEAIDYLTRDGLAVDSCRIRAFPFNQEIEDFIDSHRTVFVVEQNRDAQMRSLLVNDCEINPKHLIPVLNYDGMPITASFIQGKIVDYMDRAKVTPLRKDSANDNTANL